MLTFTDVGECFIFLQFFHIFQLHLSKVSRSFRMISILYLSLLHVSEAVRQQIQYTPAPISLILRDTLLKLNCFIHVVNSFPNSGVIEAPYLPFMPLFGRYIYSPHETS